MMNKILDFLFDKKAYPHLRNVGILILRVGAGYFLFFNHGIDKLMDGPEKWEKIGALGMGAIGISFGHLFFGFLAAVSESILCLCVSFGFLTRISSFLVSMTMLVAGIFHIGRGESPESAFLYLSIYMAIFAVGAGSFSLDRKLWKN